MIFATAYNKDRAKPEKNSGVSLVEKAGYVSAQKRIESLILAGHRLQESRIAQYDFEHNNLDEDFDDPTRTPGYDMADAFQANLTVQERLRQSKLDQEALKASQTAQEAQNEVTEPKTGV